MPSHAAIVFPKSIPVRLTVEDRVRTGYLPYRASAEDKALWTIEVGKVGHTTSKTSSGDLDPG